MNELFLKIINMSISASWLILAVLILRLVLKKAPKWVNVLLWGIVAVRLICPLSFESTLSLIPSSETIPLDIEMAAKPTIDSGVPAINSVVNPVLSSFAPPQHVLTSANPLQIWIPILNIIWLIGVGALLLYTAVSYGRLCRKVDTAVRYKDNIFQSENVSSPFVLGIIKPRIYLPFNMNGQDLEHVVAHEQAHIRRKDHWWKPLGFFLLTIYWFNPLMWLAYVLLCRDIELACDEKVIKELGNEQRADYTQALVACSVNRRMIAACPLAFGEVGVKDRVKSVMNYKKPAFWIIILAVIACVIVAVCFLTNPMGFQFDEAIHTIVSANHFDMRNADDAVAIEMNPAQISELSSRLAGVKNTKKSDEYGGFTPGYQISALLKDGTYIRINGYSFSNNSMVDIEWNGERYVVSDGEFQDYLSRICVGGDVAVAEPVPSVTKWFVKLGDKIVAIPMISKEQQKQESVEQKDFEMNADTSGLTVAGHIGTWHTIDRHEVGGHSFYLMEHDTYGDEAACIIVDERGKLVLDDVYNGFDDDTLRLLDLEVKEVSEMPDPALSVQDMKDYGYAWAGVLPAGQEAAEKALEKGCEVYRLYSDNTEGLCVDAKEIADHATKGGMLGISKESWMAALEKENYLKAAEMSMEDDYGMIDGIINNGPKEDKTAEVKAPERGEKSSIMDRLKSAKAEKQKECCPPQKHKGEIEL